MPRQLFILLTVLFMGCASTHVPQRVAPTPPSTTVHLKILAVNDLHGHLEGPSGRLKVQGEPVESGGLVYLGTRLAEIQKYSPNSVIVGAGDFIGASPLLSALFHDEPTIEGLDAVGLEINAVGNHEFDEGVEELLRMANGGCHPKDGCLAGHQFGGAKFGFLAANVFYEDTGLPVFPAYEVREYEGVPVGFIGLTLKGTAEIVTPEARKGIRFGDENEAIDAAVAELKRQNVRTIIVLIHEGGTLTQSEDPNDCEGFGGPIVKITNNMAPEVDVVISGHTHKPYVCEVAGKLVTSAKAFGQVVTEIDLELSRETREVVSRSARNLPVYAKGERHQAVDKIIEDYKALAAPLANRVIGSVAADLVCDVNDHGECDTGRLIADMQLAATKKEGAEIAFMNTGGIRGDIHSENGNVTYEDAHRVQPFANSLVTINLSGTQVLHLLEDQWRGSKRRILQPSKGFTYQWSASAPKGAKVVPGSVKLNGKPVEADSVYRITVNSYLAGGGDGKAVLQEGKKRVIGPLDLDAFAEFFETHSPVEIPTDVRTQGVP